MAATTLTQVLVNVLTNALHAVADRHVDGGQVVVRAKIEAQLLVLEVVDDGVGMPPEVLAQVGTPFFTTRPGATGLGISQCQRLVGAAGGRFQIESTPAHGTKVTISLPFP
jgi:signal transduction histidine kinase